ncbi:esterase/lipase family protein [Candidatus Cardinium hertigii]|uniref:esterase/lipase family protein n=1 Tax=Candidatus Cardinium hertigii TaxID=247481 RepID=UPI0021A8B106|nr:alpha/beta hydrolase [Candidatus Cardinium hertigii]
MVLLHGLSRISYDFETMKAVLRQKFPHATIVALKSVNKDLNKKGNVWYSPPSVMLSIKKQAELAYEEIKTLIGRDKHVVLVGHSQGGLRAFTLIKEYGAVLKREVGITIDQLITIGTPWKGAPVMDHFKNPKWVTEKLDQEKNILEKIQKGYRRDLFKHIFKNYAGIAEKMPSLAKYLYNHTNGFKRRKKHMSGADDLSPSSDFIRYVASGIKELGVPVTAIAGVLNFSEFFPLSSSVTAEDLLKLNHTYAELIGGTEHDMLLPVDTQLAEGLDKKDFECIKIYESCHGNKVGIPVKKDIPECNNEQVIQKVVACIEKTFYSTTEIEKDITERE